MTLTNLVKSLDNNPAYFALNFRNKYQYRSIIGGILMLIYVIVSAVIFGFKTYRLFQRDQIYINSQIVVNNDINNLDISSGQFRLNLFTYIQQDYHTINFTDLGKFGLRVYVLEQNLSKKGGKAIINYTQHQAVQCTDGFRIEDFNICPPKNLDYNIFGRYDFQTPQDEDKTYYRRFFLMVDECQVQNNSDCKNYSGQNFYFVLVFYNNIINSSSIDNQALIIKSPKVRVFQSELSLKKGLKLGKKLKFDRVKINTQSSIWPQLFHYSSSQSRQGWTFNEQIMQYSSFDSYPQTFLEILFQRSQYTQVYSRWFKNFDTVLAEMSGIMGLMGAVLFFLYYGYNNWSFEQFIRKQMGYTYKNPNILRYYAYLFKRTFRCICKRKQQKDMLLNEQTQEEKQKFIEQLDYYLLRKQLKRINKPQSAIKYSSKYSKIQQSELQIPPEQVAQQQDPKVEEEDQRPSQRKTQAQLLQNLKIN